MSRERVAAALPGTLAVLVLEAEGRTGKYGAPKVIELLDCRAIDLGYRPVAPLPSRPVKSLAFALFRPLNYRIIEPISYYLLPCCPTDLSPC